MFARHGWKTGQDGRASAVLGFGAGALIAWILLAPVAWAECAADRLDIVTQTATQSFSVEVADTQALQQLGLMNRSHMASASGMLFVFDAPKHAQFWMRNTLIPLDMIFADSAGVITHIHENALPRDETVIDGGLAVQFVLEINGGLARRLGVSSGDHLRHPQIAGSGCSAP